MYKAIVPIGFLFLPIVAITTDSLAGRLGQSGAIVGEGNDPIKIVLTSPRGGWSVDRMVKVSGSLSDPTVNPVTISINGDRYLIRTVNGEFQRKFPVCTGKNVITVQAANKNGTFKKEKTFFSKTEAVALMAILTSDTDNVYTDLHVYEPLTDLKDPLVNIETGHEHVFWAQTQSKSGGNFYLNEQSGDFDQPGFGPYLYTHRSPPLGIYRIDANYWPSGDKAHVLATLNLALFAGTPKEVRKSIRAPLVVPGETLTLAFVRIDKNQMGYIYAPLRDPKPTTTHIWPQWVIDYKPRQKSNPGGFGEGD
ncbi:MAG: DUF2135 domain-containing protein [Bdellovibrionales bacterium]|nr:DUF2135 domain-containing protein [Bdellovibrionales bacterium]